MSLSSLVIFSFCYYQVCHSHQKTVLVFLLLCTRIVYKRGSKHFRPGKLPSHKIIHSSVMWLSRVDEDTSGLLIFKIR